MPNFSVDIQTAFGYHALLRVKHYATFLNPMAFPPFGKIFTNPDGRCGIGETVPGLVFGQAEKDRFENLCNNKPVLNDIRK